MKRFLYRNSICFLTIIMFFSLIQSPLSAEPTPTYHHPALNVNLNGNSQSTNWLLSSTVAPDELWAEDDSRFKFYDGSAVDFSLATKLENLEAGSYVLTLAAHVNNELADGAGFKVTTYDGQLTPQTKTIDITPTLSSWSTPREYKLYGVVVGNDGMLDLEWAVKTLGDNYGFIRSIALNKIDPILSSGLSINNLPIQWTPLHTNSIATFKVFTADAIQGLEYWNSTNYTVQLATSVYLEANTNYSMLSHAHGNSSLNLGSKIIVNTAKGSYEKILNPSGSYSEPSSITENSFFTTGASGLATIEIVIQAPSNHYGYLTNLQFSSNPIVDKLPIQSSLMLLRTGKTQTLLYSALDYDSFTYESANTHVATVNPNGTVTAVGEGETIITVNAYKDDVLAAQGTSNVYVSNTFQTQASYGNVQVEPIHALQNNARPDFIMGADISTIAQLEQSGRAFYDELGQVKPLMTILKDSGINWIRVRSWVDPFDSDGNPYGAGNINAEETTRIAKQARAAGLNVLLDIHYSDFWTDPARQSKPKAWANLNEAELKQEVYDYTYSLLENMRTEHALPQMVQIGNEINGGFLWPTTGSSTTASGKGITNAVPYLQEGISAVRDFETDYTTGHIDIVLHRTNLNDGLNKVTEFYDALTNLDYDVIGLSYYPFWHGSVSNMQNIMNSIADRYNKKVAVVETSYAYGLDTPLYNGSTSNSFGEDLQESGGYLATVQGQTNAIRDVINAVAQVPNENGIGVFYWEPAWLPGTSVPWGTAYAAAYQGESITNNEGSAWVNQAMFNQFGEKLPSLDVFNRIRESGSYTPPHVVSIKDLQLTTYVGDNSVLPATVSALFSDDQFRTVDVISWSPETYDLNKVGTYNLVGYVQDGFTFNATITVQPTNYVINGGLEATQTNDWILSGASISEEKPYTGTKGIHFWNVQQVVAKQTLTDIPNGKYTLSVYSRIGVDGDPIENTSRFYAKTSNNEYSSPLVITGWQSWSKITVNNIVVSNGKVEIGVVVDNAINNYGDFDDFELILVEPAQVEEVITTPPTETTADSSLINNGFVRTSADEYAITLEQNKPLQLNQTLLASLQNKQLLINYPNLIFAISGDQLKPFNSLSFSNESVTDKVASPNNGSIEILSTLTISSDSNNPIAITIHHEKRDTSIALYTIDEQGNIIFAGGYWRDDEYIVTIEPNKTYILSKNSKHYNDLNIQSESIQFFTAAGVISGDQNNNLELERPATRLQFAKIISNLFGLHTPRIANPTYNGHVFQDVSASSWAASYVDAVASSGIMNGVSSDYFNAEANINAEQLLVVFARAVHITPHSPDSSNMSHWSSGYIQALVQSGYISEEAIALLDLKSALTKEQIITLLYSMYTKK